MINIEVSDPGVALEWMKDLAEESGEPFKICQIGDSFFVRRLYSKGTWTARYYPQGRRRKKRT